MDILANFGENLTELMFDNKISPEQLAKAIGIDFSEIYRYQRKEYLPNLSNAVKLADYFNCSVDGMLGLSPLRTDVKFKPAPPFSERFRVLLTENNTTRYRISKKTKININSLDAWYNGKFTPSLDKVMVLAKHFKCSVDYILGRE